MRIYSVLRTHARPYLNLLVLHPFGESRPSLFSLVRLEDVPVRGQMKARHIFEHCDLTFVHLVVLDRAHDALQVVLFEWVGPRRNVDA